MSPKGVKDSIDKNTYKIGDIITTFNTMNNEWVLCDGNNKSASIETKDSVLYPSLYTASFGSASFEYLSLEEITLYDQKTFNNPIVIYHSDDRNNTDRELIGVYKIESGSRVSAATTWRNASIISTAYGDGIAFIYVSDMSDRTKLFKYVYSSHMITEISPVFFSYTYSSTNVDPYSGWWYKDAWYIIHGSNTSGLRISKLNSDGVAIKTNEYPSYTNTTLLVKFDHYAIYLTDYKNNYIDLDNFGDLVNSPLPINFVRPNTTSTNLNFAISKDYGFCVGITSVSITYVIITIWDLPKNTNKQITCYDQTGYLNTQSSDAKYCTVFIDPQDIIHVYVTTTNARHGLYALLKRDSCFGLFNTISNSSYTNAACFPQNAVYAYPSFCGDNILIYYRSINDYSIKTPSIITNNLKLTYMKVKN